MAGVWEELSHSYTPSQDEVRDGIYRWGMGEGDGPAVCNWIKKLQEGTWLASAVYFAHVWHGMAGVFLCISSPESTRLSKFNSQHASQHTNGGIRSPEYLAFDVYWYPGIVFGNLAGFTNPGAQRVGNLGEVLAILCSGIPDWTQHVGVPDRGWVYGGLRRLFQLVGIGQQAEVVSGLSWRRLHSLDVFVAIHSAAMGVAPPDMVLWNVCYDDSTRIPNQDEWWAMPSWRCMGQCEYGNILDYQVLLRRGPLQRSLGAVVGQVGSRIAGHRIGIITRQVHPEATPEELRRLYD